jgi:FtsX-like permease family protein
MSRATHAPPAGTRQPDGSGEAYQAPGLADRAGRPAAAARGRRWWKLNSKVMPVSEDSSAALEATPPQPVGASVAPQAPRRRCGPPCLIQRRPVAVVVITALATAIVTAAVILGGMVALSGATRSPVAPPSSPAPTSVPGTQTQVSVFLNSAVTEEQKRAIESALRRLASVKEVRFESRQEAYARFKEQFKDAPDLIAATRPDSFPDSFRVTLKTHRASATSPSSRINQGYPRSPARQPTPHPADNRAPDTNATANRTPTVSPTARNRALP